MKNISTDKSNELQSGMKKQIYICAFKCVIIAILIIFLLLKYKELSTVTNIKYNENSEIDYRVYLKENEYYDEKYVEKDNQYIASIIDYINAHFKYDLNISEKNIDYDYKYRIEALVDVEEKSTDKSIYTFTEDLVPEKTISHNSNTDAKISEKIEIDYNKYNDLIKKFVSVYELDDSESSLIINMYISIDEKNGKFIRTKDDEYKMSLEIPLTTKTVAIDLDSNSFGCDKELIPVEKPGFFWLKIGLVFTSLLEFLLIVRLVRFITNSRTPEEIYNLELNRIISNYGSYIQTARNVVDLKKYQLIFLDTFEDVLEIRDTIHEPVLMYMMPKKLKTYFMIPSKTNILYIYLLKVNEPKKEFEKDIGKKE